MQGLGGSHYYGVTKRFVQTKTKKFAETRPEGRKNDSSSKRPKAGVPQNTGGGEGGWVVIGINDYYRKKRKKNKHIVGEVNHGHRAG